MSQATEQYKHAADYVDRIFKGQAKRTSRRGADQYELVLNLKAAKELGLEIPPSLLTTADEVIE
jgi:putative ABC transport system substrate-binding protein